MKIGCFMFTALVTVSATATAATRTDYLDIIEAAVSAYSQERRAEYISRVERDGITEHGFARLTSNIGTLVANERRPDLRDEFVRMMDLCAREEPVAEKRNGARLGGHFAPGAEFAVKELVFAVVEAEKSGFFAKEKTDAWRSAFTPMAAAEIYSRKPAPGDPVAQNWTIFGTASEQARIENGMGGDPAWVEKYVSDQLRFFDGNGMYRDPGCPMTYDFVTRLQFAVTLDCGYDGPSRKKLVAFMDKSAEPTLAMQSVTGEIPFGGRSNQFLHNDTCYAALCEWYAARDARNGNIERAGRFRAAADRAVANVKRHLAERPLSHVKNRFPVESKYGCEAYAYFDKYMVTMGSWAYLAMRFADESIPPAAASEKDNVFVTGEDFHRVVVNAKDWTLQFDLEGQPGYDATGLGRIQRKGAPGALALSVPFPVASHYIMDVTNSHPLAIGPVGVSQWTVKSASCNEVVLSASNCLWRTGIRADSVAMMVKKAGDIDFVLPAFAFDGAEKTEIESGGRMLTITYRDWTCRWKTDGEIIDTGKTFGNRNGHYRIFTAKGRDQLRLQIEVAPRESVCAARRIDALMAKMTLREKIGQCVQIELAKIPLSNATETAEWFAKYPVGSVFMGKDLAALTDGAVGNAESLARCAAATKIPLTVAGDLGPVIAPAMLPGNGALGALDDLAAAREYGRLIGRLGRANGYNWVFAPCVDLALNWLNPIMGCRTMGDDAEKVAALSVEIARGMQECGLSASAKHYPGDGVDHRDQHLGPCVNNLTKERWMETYGKVYRRLFEAGCDSIMIGHISLPFADPPKGEFGLPPPAVMSAPVSTGLLRDELGFKGVAITDALMMGGFVIYKFDREERRYLEAFKAGADVLLWPRLGVFDLMEEAVASGEIAMERLDASVRRILEMKEKEGLFDEVFRPPSGPDAMLLAEADAFTRKATEREVALVRNTDGLIPLDRAKTKKVLLWIADGSGKKTLSSYDVMKKGFEERGAEVTVALNGNCLDLWKREAAGERYDAVFFLFASGMHAVKNAIRPVGGAGECIWTMINTDFHKPVPIAFGYPFLLQDAPWLKTLVNVHSGPNRLVQETVVRLLYGELPFRGESPFDLSVDLGVQK